MHFSFGYVQRPRITIVCNAVRESKRVDLGKIDSRHAIFSLDAFYAAYNFNAMLFFVMSEMKILLVINLMLLLLLFLSSISL